MMRKLRPVLEWGWFLLLLVGIAAYLANNVATISDQLSSVSVARLALSGSVLAVGYLWVVELLRCSTNYVGWKPTYRHMFYINAMSQLAKYLPGSIWQYVSRAGFYRAGGVSLANATRAIILESIWIVSSSVLVGLVACALYFTQAQLMTVVLALVVVFIAWTGILFQVTRIYFRQAFWRLTLRVQVVQLLTWLTLGLSFWLLIPDEGAVKTLPLVIGAFGLAFGAGYVVFFAPGGIGVREIVLIAILTLVIPSEKVIVYAAIHRFIWVVVELLNGLIARFLLRPGGMIQVDTSMTPDK
ncbi:MAG: flippase-like domain-containing protein [Anaerolineae bacterium]|nr:flippase-like domain-containing protein [Anaerolineae bacterium]